MNWSMKKEDALHYTWEKHHTTYLLHAINTGICIHMAVPFASYASNFRFFLTILPKSFSFIPHSTSKLLASSMYQVFNDMYHSIDIPLPKNATLEQHQKKGIMHGKLECHLHCCFIPKAYMHLPIEVPFRLHISELMSSDCSNAHFPVHSPLLQKPCLVCIPLLTYMLKFSR